MKIPTRLHDQVLSIDRRVFNTTVTGNTVEMTFGGIKPSRLPIPLFNRSEIEQPQTDDEEYDSGDNLPAVDGDQILE